MLNQKEKITSFLPRKDWTAEKIHQYIGNFNRSYFAYAGNESLRQKAASGGVATALLSFLLDSQQIDGALVCRSVIKDGKVRPEFFVAKTMKDLLSAQGSKYMAVDFSEDALPLLRSFNGRLAVTLLPCDTSTLKRAMENDADLAERITFAITLFCGHNSVHELTDMVTHKLAPKGALLLDFHHRQGHWRGTLRSEFDNGKIVEKPFTYFSDYQNLYFFCQQKCHHCNDHSGYDGDISVGDIWSLRMKEEPIKHSAVITRTPAGVEVFADAVRSGVLIAKEEPIEEICEGQARSMPFHYNISARAKAGKLLGFKIKDRVYARVRWNDYLVAWLALFNEKFSRSAKGRWWIAHTPRFMLKFLLYVMKGLESF
jgi:coenzyme F420-reducing hydrogenase beta subunit